MCEGVGSHGEMDGGMIIESIVSLDLTLDGASEGLGHFSPKIIVFSGIPVLLKCGVEPLFVDHVFPIPTCAYGS